MIPDKSSSTAWRLQPVALVASLALLSTGCGSQQTGPVAHESVNATLWVQTSAEYAASAEQAYRNAIASLDLALADPRWTAALEQRGDYSELPPAVLIDIDQTVLDTGTYNARIIGQYGRHVPEKFNQWCEKTTAAAIPGAKTFVDYATGRDVTIIYYSRRVESLRDCTTRNLEALGFPVADQKYLLLNDDQPATRKGRRRTELASMFRILLLVGDDLDDFVDGSRTDPAARRALASLHADRWGKEWIILPNPIFGGWDRSLYDFDNSLTREEQLKLKRKQLQE